MQGRLRILVVDDDAMFRNLIMTHLRKDYLVSVAVDGQDAYQKALQHRPDLAIIDIQMPGWDGIKTLQAFRENENLKSVKAMVLTSDASRETVMAAIQNGANDYVIKSAFTKEELLIKVQRMLASPTGNTYAQDEATATGATSTQTNSVDNSHASAVPAPHTEDTVTATVPEETMIEELVDNWE
jgi:DNA-binding response OmpR family regulator